MMYVSSLSLRMIDFPRLNFFITVLYLISYTSRSQRVSTAAYAVTYMAMTLFSSSSFLIHTEIKWFKYCKSARQLFVVSEPAFAIIV